MTGNRRTLPLRHGDEVGIDSVDLAKVALDLQAE